MSEGAHLESLRNLRIVHLEWLMYICVVSQGMHANPNGRLYIEDDRLRIRDEEI